MKFLVKSFATAMMLFSPTLVAGQDWIDYELLLQQHGREVKVSTDSDGKMIRSLDLGDGVTVQCVDENCIGMDLRGAVGCGFQIMIRLSESAALCPEEVDEATRKTLSENVLMFSEFIQKNAVPPRTPGYIDELLRSQREEIEGLDRAEICPRFKAPDGDLFPMVTRLTSEEVRPALQRMISRPRLPVINPCL